VHAIFFAGGLLVGASGCAIAAVLLQSATGHAAGAALGRALRLLVGAASGALVIGPAYAIGLALQRRILGRAPALVDP
jgi:hypothetical protein